MEVTHPNFTKVTWMTVFPNKVCIIYQFTKTCSLIHPNNKTFAELDMRLNGSAVFAHCADMSLSRHVGIYIVQQFNVHSYKRQNDTNHVTLELDCVDLVISLY